MPETWLMDVVKVKRLERSAIDPIFLSLIEPGSITVFGATAIIENDCIKGPEGDHLIGGIRKGFAGRRFVPQTREQMLRSMKFWEPQFG